MKLLNKGIMESLIYSEPMSEGTNRFLEVPFQIKINGVLNIIDMDVMIVLDENEEVEELEFDFVHDVYTEEQEDGIRQLLKTAYNGI
jgi:hypothetical protein